MEAIKRDFISLLNSSLNIVTAINVIDRIRWKQVTLSPKTISCFLFTHNGKIYKQIIILNLPKFVRLPKKMCDLDVKFVQVTRI